MSLMQLLTVGRSLRNIVDQPNRYKMTRANLLPKFGSTKDEEANAFTGVGPDESGTAAGEMVSANLPPALPSNGTGLSSVEVASRTSAASQTAQSSLAYPRGRWTWLNKGFLPKPVPKAPPSPFRAERPLEAVKVVRNDLNDTDLEVVAARPALPPAQGTTPTADSKAVPAFLRRMAARVFGARKS